MRYVSEIAMSIAAGGMALLTGCAMATGDDIGGSAAEARQHRPLVITKEIDRSTPFSADVATCAEPALYEVDAETIIACSARNYLQVGGIGSESLHIEYGSLDGQALAPFVLTPVSSTQAIPEELIVVAETGTENPIPGPKDVTPACDGFSVHPETGDAWVCTESIALLLPAVQKVRGAAVATAAAKDNPLVFAVRSRPTTACAYEPDDSNGKTGGYREAESGAAAAGHDHHDWIPIDGTQAHPTGTADEDSSHISWVDVLSLNPNPEASVTLEYLGLMTVHEQPKVSDTGKGFLFEDVLAFGTKLTGRGCTTGE